MASLPEKEAHELCAAARRVLDQAPGIAECNPEDEKRLWLALQEAELKLATP